MEANASVGGGDHVRIARAPGRDDALDRLRREVRPVGEHDHSRLRLGGERAKAAPQRRADPELPLLAAHRAGIGLHVVRAEHDNDVVDGAAAEPGEDFGEEDPLLGGAEPRRGAGGQDDREDQSMTSSVIVLTTTGWVGSSVFGSPSTEMRATTSIPSVTRPMTA